MAEIKMKNFAGSIAGAFYRIPLVVVSLSPLFGQAIGVVQTTGSYVIRGAGTPGANECAKWDASGNLVSAGVSCGVTGNTGEANTASNVGTGGVGVFDAKSSLDLQFRTIYTASGKLSVTLNSGQKRIEIDAVPASFDISAFGGSLALSQIASAAKQGNGSKIQLFGGGSVNTNDCAKFDGSGNIVSAGAACGSGGGGGGGGTANPSVSFTSQTSTELTHNLGTLNVVPACYDGSNNLIIPNSINVTSTNSITVTFASAQTGRCVVNGTGGGGGGGGTTYTGSTGIQIAGSTIAVDVATVPTFIAASSSIDFASINNSACSSQTLTLSGASTGDAVAARWPNTLEAGLFGTMRVSAANTIEVRLCNLSGGAVNPANQTFGAVIVRSF